MKLPSLSQSGALQMFGTTALISLSLQLCWLGPLRIIIPNIWPSPGSGGLFLGDLVALCSYLLEKDREHLLVLIFRWRYRNTAVQICPSLSL